MKADKFKTQVVFRLFGRDIIALFPYEPYNAGLYSYDCISSYMHVGQHGSANYSNVIKSSLPVNESEYKELYNELVGIGYNLEVLQKRNTYKAITEWRKARVNFQELV